MIKFLLVLLLGGFYHQAFAASVEGLALLRTLHARLCADPTGEACTLLASKISTIENRAIEDFSSRVSSMRNSTAKVITLSNFLSPFVSNPEDDMDDCDDDDSEDIEINQKLEDLLQGQDFYRKFVFNALTACIVLLAITISANLHLYVTNCLEKRKARRNVSRHRRATMLYSDLQNIHRQHNASV